MKLPPALLVLLLSLPAAAATTPQPLQRCEPDAYVYQWRDASGQLQMGDCAPEGAEALRAIPRNSLKPTLIQPPPKPQRVPRQMQKKRSAKPPARARGPSGEELRALSAKCRWLLGRVEHVKGLVAQHRAGSSQPSIWQPELRRWRAELRKARCGASPP